MRRPLNTPERVERIIHAGLRKAHPRGPAAAPRAPLDAVEHEIAKADIEFLKAQEIESGDRAKWEASQGIIAVALSFMLMTHSPQTGWGERLGLFTGAEAMTTCDTERDTQQEIARIKGSRDEFYCYQTFNPPQSKWWEPKSTENRNASPFH